VRDQLGLSDSALSKQLSTLEEAGYITIERPLSERRRVRAQLTVLGAQAIRGSCRRTQRDPRDLWRGDVSCS
jgi:DNA-binding MarR family transcriptional regulator